MSHINHTITHVTFKRHVNTGNFESFEIEATAMVPNTSDDDDAWSTAMNLQAFVDHLCLVRSDVGEVVDDLP